MLQKGERADDLGGGLSVLQDPSDFMFGIDAVLLAHFPELRRNDRVMDLCTGSGVIPILMSRDAPEGVRFCGVEIRKSAAERAARSVAMNGLDDRIRIENMDLKDAASVFGAAAFTLVTANPPYIPVGAGKESPDPAKAAARHEIFASFADVASGASALLKQSGRFAFVHRPARMAELFRTLEAFHFGIKRLRLVYPFRDAEANLFLCEAVKGAKSCVRTEAPLIVYETPGVYTDEILKIYKMG